MSNTKSEYRKLAAVAAAVMPIHKADGLYTASELARKAKALRAYRRHISAVIKREMYG